ncbi:hypothetical protein OA860_02615 [Prochlorococcus sp. AH-716-E13]|nr:hypothetical protein [Prochlorococcus sp. AH-716-E13]
MKRIIPYIAFFCFTGFTATNGVPTIAGGCNNQMNKNIKTNCDKEETDCLTNKTEKYKFDKTINS